MASPEWGGPDGQKQIVLIPYNQAYEAGFEDMRQRIPDVRKIRDIIGWEARVSLEETLERVIAFYRNGGGNGRSARAVEKGGTISYV